MDSERKKVYQMLVSTSLTPETGAGPPACVPLGFAACASDDFEYSD